MTKRLAEVAKKAGVSEATVSRVLNGRSGVSESTRASVLTALDVLGYERPTKLRGERGRLVGLVLPELQNPIFPALAEVVTASLAQRGFTPALCARTIGGVPERDYIEMLLDHQVSGVVFAGGSYALADAEHGHYRQLLDRRMPVVMVNAGVDGLGFPHISTDDAVAVEQAYGHLRSLGHEKIGMVMGLGVPRTICRRVASWPPSRNSPAGARRRTGWSSAPRSRWRAPGWPPGG